MERERIKERDISYHNNNKKKQNKNKYRNIVKKHDSLD